MFNEQRLFHLMEKIYSVIDEYDSEGAPLLCSDIFTVLAVPLLEAALNTFVTKEAFMERISQMWDTAQGLPTVKTKKDTEGLN
jgi:hypothetical protein